VGWRSAHPVAIDVSSRSGGSGDGACGRSVVSGGSLTGPVWGVRIHLDTDVGGDPDDVCAIALLLALPHVELVAITTNLEEDDGLRAGCARRVLDIAGAWDTPTIAGAGPTLTDGTTFPSTARDPRYWTPPVDPQPAVSSDDAVNAVEDAIVRGDTIVTIGALTNLAQLELARPGALAGAKVVAMGGWTRPLTPGLPQWGPERDFNFVCDPQATDIAIAAIGDLTLVTLPAAAEAHLRARDVPVLRSIGAIGVLMTQQAEAYAEDNDRAALAAAHDGLPTDFLNFHWDPVTCAIAAGWDGAQIDVVDDLPQRNGNATRVVTAIDGEAFSSYWLQQVQRLG